MTNLPSLFLALNLMVGAIMIPDHDDYDECDGDKLDGRAILILYDHSNLKVPSQAIMDKIKMNANYRLKEKWGVKDLKCVLPSGVCKLE